MTSTNAPSALSSLRILAAALTAAPLVILVAVSFALTGGGGTPPTWALGVVALVGVLGASLATLIGYRTPAIAPGTTGEDARRQALAAFSASTMLRLALCETAALAGVALAFVVQEGGLLVLVVGVIVAVFLMILLGWPGDRSITRVQESLDREGGRSQLVETLNAPR